MMSTSDFNVNRNHSRGARMTLEHKNEYFCLHQGICILLFRFFYFSHSSVGTIVVTRKLMVLKRGPVCCIFVKSNSLNMEAFDTHSLIG